jgi:hypothetical protein
LNHFTVPLAIVSSFENNTAAIQRWVTGQISARDGKQVHRSMAS